MLDQNTDRMWFVIGAVIVGAAIIFIANGTLPTLFASVADSFEESSAESTAVIDEMVPNTGRIYVYHEDVEVSTYPTLAEVIAYDEDIDEWTVAISPQPLGWSGGLSLKEGVAVVPYGFKSTVSYDVWSPVATYAGNDINNTPVGVAEWGSTDDSIETSKNDNDALERRENVSKLADLKEGIYDPQISIPANQWTTITFTSYNTSEWNVEKVALNDWSSFGAYNPFEDKDLIVKIKNVNVRITEAN